MTRKSAPRMPTSDSLPPVGVAEAMSAFLAARRSEGDWDARREVLAATAELVAEGLTGAVNPQLVRELRLLVDELAGMEGDDAFDALAAELSASVGDTAH